MKTQVIFTLLQMACKNQNFIPWILRDNRRVDNIRQIGDTFTSFYKDLYGSAQESHFQINWPSLLNAKGHNDLTTLDIPFLEEEIRVVVFSMSANKALKLDGFPILFFQKLWEIVKFDIF